MKRESMEASLAKMYGEQPSFDYTGVTDVDYHNAKAFDWFNANLPSSKKREALVDYAKRYRADAVDAVAALDLSDILFSNAIYAKMLVEGAKLNPSRFAAFSAAFDGYVVAGTHKAAAKAAKALPTVQDFVRDRLIELSAEMNYIIDSFVEGGFTSSFDPIAWVTEQGVKAVYCERLVADLLEPMFVELSCAIKNTDPELAEGWGHLTVVQAKKLAKFLWLIMEGFAGRVEAAKTERKPRMRKPKPPAKQVKNLKYKASDVALKITSIDPKKLVGATMLIAFNTKTRAMVTWVADDAKGFTVKGSTLMGVDVPKSFSKTIRKPSEILPMVVRDSKKAVTREIDGIRAVAKPVTGRINKDMVLLRVF